MKQLPLMSRGLDEIIARHRGQTITAACFIHQARSLALSLGGYDRVINLCHDRHLFSLSFAASILAGCTTLLPANRLTETVDRLMQTHPGSLIISDRDIDGLAYPCLDPTASLAVQGLATRTPLVDENLLAAVVFTSGSTGPSTSIPKYWKTLHASSTINAAEYGPRGPLTWAVATVPPQHMWGLETSVLLPWFGPVAVTEGQPFFAADIITAIEQLPAPRALISTPVHLRNLAESGLAMVPIDLVYSATAPLSSALAERMEATTGGRVIEVFGCSEAGCLARRDAARDEPWTLFRDFTLERVAEQFQVRADHLPGPVALLDLLHVAPDGRFRLIGRHSDLVNIAGKRASLADLTEALLAIDGVIDGVIFQPADNEHGPVSRLAALVVAPDMSAHEVRQALARQIDPAFMPRPLRLVPALPRAESGKLPRQSLVHFFRQVCEPTG
jgi:acyl-coenzyme A synthetase/AMP-(fatty) acid ligase